MSRTLVLMRHADPETGSGSSDRSRPLSATGRIQAHNSGVWLQRIVEPQLVLSSTAARARQTAEGLLCPQIEYFDELYGAGPEQIREVLTQVSDEVTSLVVVAHNPGIAYLAMDLDGAETTISSFPTASMAVFSLDEDWTDLVGSRLRTIHRVQI